MLNIGYVYDAVWTIALALNSSISILEERGLGRLEDFTYNSVEMADVFSEEIASLSFEGISVSVVEICCTYLSIYLSIYISIYLSIYL